MKMRTKSGIRTNLYKLEFRNGNEDKFQSFLFRPSHATMINMRSFSLHHPMHPHQLDKASKSDASHSEAAVHTSCLHYNINSRSSLYFN
jgi:hypothetical protein